MFAGSKGNFVVVVLWIRFPNFSKRRDVFVVMTRSNRIASFCDHSSSLNILCHNIILHKRLGERVMTEPKFCLDFLHFINVLFVQMYL